MAATSIQWIGLVGCALLLAACTPHPIYRNDVVPSVPTGPERGRKAAEKPPLEKPRLKEPPIIITPPATAHPLDPATISTAQAYQIGKASYYGKKFHGRKTANGETFNMYKLTAAHRVLPLGTLVKVTHLGTGRWVEVKINDRGPFIEGRILDLSFAAALELEMVTAGVAEVMIEIVKAVE